MSTTHSKARKTKSATEYNHTSSKKKVKHGQSTESVKIVPLILQQGQGKDCQMSLCLLIVEVSDK